MKKIFLKWQRQTRKLGFLAAMITVSMVAFFMLSFPLNAQISKSTELRGVWLTNIDSDVLFEKERLKQSLRTLHQLNFNTVY
ncbi:MAG: family 10 glycosylhydrolase, partial [Cuspidothrix sp.]